MYAKVENNKIVEYPLFEGMLQERFPDLAFPLDTHNTPIPEGYVKVNFVERPLADVDYYYVEVAPKLVDGVWTQQWNKVDYTLDQKEANKVGLAMAQRRKRDKILEKSDVYMLADRWAAMTDEKKSEWSTYRQALRDVTKQQDFPITIEWPVPPAGFDTRGIF